MLCRFADAVLVLSTDPEDVLLHSCEFAGLESGVFHCGRQLHPLFFVCLPTFHNVVGDQGATVVPGRVPCQEARLVGDLGDVKSSWRARFILRGKIKHYIQASNVSVSGADYF